MRTIKLYILIYTPVPLTYVCIKYYLSTYSYTYKMIMTN